VPFLAILGVPGLYAIGSRMLQSDRPLWPVLLVSLLSAAGLGRAMFDHRTDATWSKYERLAERIDKVTAPGAPLFANEPIYFLTKRLPPTGYELDYTHRVDLPREERARLHIITDEEVKQQVQSGRFATAYSCEDDDSAEYGLKALYRREEKQSDCSIYWEWKGKR
jgi:hypothetical protein